MAHTLKNRNKHVFFGTRVQFEKFGTLYGSTAWFKPHQFHAWNGMQPNGSIYGIKWKAKWYVFMHGVSWDA